MGILFKLLFCCIIVFYCHQSVNIFICGAALGKRVNLVHFNGAPFGLEMIFDEIDMLILLDQALPTGRGSHLIQKW